MGGKSGAGDWLVVQELLERGDPAFVAELRRISDADALGAFAPRWYADPRPATRRLLMAYLDQPLNAYRHEALVKRLFKLAEAAGDDAVMARFLALFDRSIRRVRRKRRHHERREVESKEQAEALAASWRALGYERAQFWERWRGRFEVTGFWREEYLITPGATAMPRGVRHDPTAEGRRQALGRHRLFSVPTRQYLRRRAWRYFRRLGRADPARYVAAAAGALGCYRDEDVTDGLALIDNWGLVHILFHRSPALVARPTGWVPAEGSSLAALEPAPIYEKAWRAAPRATFDVILAAQCRPVRRWAVLMARRDPAATRAVAGLEEWLGLLVHDDPDVVALAAELLRGAEGLDRLDPDRWLTLAESAGPAAQGVLAELMARHLAPDRVPFGAAARLAAGRPLPLARLGLDWLKARTPRTEAECRIVLDLLEAQAEPLRPEILRWARGVLSAAPGFRPDWVLEFLDARRADARAEGWAWLRGEPRVRDDVSTWRRLLESPHDDVRLPLVAELESRLAGRDPEDLGGAAADPGQIRLLWASVLLNVHRGGRAKPVVIRQLLGRIGRRPEEAAQLLPLLGVALRSVRGPEWRAGLAGVVQLVERHPDALPAVRAAFPELRLA